jgi:putative transposase
MAVNRKRVQRLMQEDNLLAVQPKSFVTTTESRHELEVYLNLGWELSTRLGAVLVVAALNKAIAKRQPPPGLIHHSDRGVQYASDAYVEILKQHQMIPSMSRPANPYDNACCESFMKTLKREEIHAGHYQDIDDLRAHIAEFIDRYYNRLRLHSALGYRTPEEFEAATQPAASTGASMSFFRHGEIYRSTKRPRGRPRKNSGEPVSPSSPAHPIDESPVGYSLAGCSPAESGELSTSKLSHPWGSPQFGWP